MNGSAIISPTWNLGASGGAGPAGGPVDTIALARELLTRSGSWPYPWCYPPPQSSPLFAPGTIALPVTGVVTEVCSFVVPIGYRGYVAAIMNLIRDSNFVDGLGMAEWTIDVNQPAGSAFPIGRPAPYWGVIDTQVGVSSVGILPMPLPFGFDLGGNDEIRYKIFLPATIAGGGANPLTPGYPQTTTCWMLGWIYKDTQRP